MGFSAFGTNSSIPNLDQYLPFPYLKKEKGDQKNNPISHKTASIFFTLQKQRKLPGHVERAFYLNSELMALINEHK